jgi:hypothetical protein
MSRTVYLAMDEGAVVARCLADKVGISAIEKLPNGGIRLVCMSGDGAARIRQKLKKQLIEGEVVRERHRPRRPLW